MYGCCGCTWSHSAHVVVGVVIVLMIVCRIATMMLGICDITILGSRPVGW